MKKKLIILVPLILIVTVLSFYLITSGGGEIMDFDCFTMTEFGTSAEHQEYEAVKTDNGVTLTYSYVGGYWDDSTSSYKEEKKIVRSVEKDEETYRMICNLLNEYKVLSWDGFDKTNPNVLDGGGFSFSLVSNNEEIVDAHGTNSYPKHHGDLLHDISNLISLDEVKEITFQTDKYTCLLPQSWLNNLQIRYGEGYAAFFFNYDDEEKTLFLIYDEPYEYGDSEHYKFIGNLEKEGEDLSYLYTRINDHTYLLEKVDDNLKNIINSLNEDASLIAESIKPINGYELKKAE